MNYHDEEFGYLRERNMFEWQNDVCGGTTDDNKSIFAISQKEDLEISLEKIISRQMWREMSFEERQERKYTYHVGLEW